MDEQTTQGGQWEDTETEIRDRHSEAGIDLSEFLATRKLVIVSNRGPVTFDVNAQGNQVFEFGEGGLVKALLGLCEQTETTWIASAQTEADRGWRSGTVALPSGDAEVDVEFVTPTESAYEGYYSVIANPLLWFLQHSMWDVPRSPIIDRDTWDAWNNGYMAVNKLFAEAIADRLREMPESALVMLQDYHLYMVPHFLRELLPAERCPAMVHFVHIPWPGPQYWRILPFGMRQTILESLSAVDLLGFQTSEDGMNFLRTCESLMRPKPETHFTTGHVAFDGHRAYVREFPISINVAALKEFADSPEVGRYRSEFEEQVGDRQLIVRVDRTEPSKNLVRGFLAFDCLLEDHPEYLEHVTFLAVLVPSRLQVEEYSDYLDDVMAVSGQVNAKHGTSDWEPIRLLVGENYPRAIAAMQLYDVLLVNCIADGMNLVAKEGPIVNRKNGVLLLSEGAGAYEQLYERLEGRGALPVAPCDIQSTSELLHDALTMDAGDRKERADNLRRAIEGHDIFEWLNSQLRTVAELGLCGPEQAAGQRTLTGKLQRERVKR